MKTWKSSESSDLRAPTGDIKSFEIVSTGPEGWGTRPMSNGLVDWIANVFFVLSILDASILAVIP